MHAPDLALEPADAEHLTAAIRKGVRLVERMPELMAVRAPYLGEKLLRLGVAQSREQAAALFQEVKKYLLLAEVAEGALPMLSQRIDEVRHQFVLFTESYAAFCHEYAGHFIHHEPMEASDAGPAPAQRRLNRLEFTELYVRWFGPVSPLWRDDLSLQSDTRLCWSEWPLPLGVRTVAEHAELVGGEAAAVVLCRTSACAHAALDFIAQHRLFLVRELPGLTAREQLALCRPLVEVDVLHISV